MPLGTLRGDDGCVRRDEDTPSHDVELLGADPTSRDADDVLPEPTHRWPRWLPFLLAAVVIGLIVHVNRKPSASPPTHPPATTQPSVSAPGTRPTASSPPASAPPITATQLGAPLLGVSAGWELFGRGDGVVVRIQLARGRITRTTVPALQSSGPVSFLVGPNLAIVRPIDYVPGYVVPDGKPAQQISASLSQGQSGPVFPGPDPNHIWVPNLGGVTAMTLSNLDSADYAGTTISIPTGSSPLEAIPDGTGYLLFPSIGGVYDARPDRLRRITTGALLAVGPTGWLTVECDARAHCVTVLINRATNARRLVGPAVTGSGSQHGVISPDGTKAALVVQSPSPAIEIIDLATGAAHAPSLRIDLSTFAEESLVWSPDSRWLFTTRTQNGHLYAVNAHTDQITDLTDITGHALPNLSQIAIRGVPAN